MPQVCQSLDLADVAHATVEAIADLLVTLAGGTHGKHSLLNRTRAPFGRRPGPWDLSPVDDPGNMCRATADPPCDLFDGDPMVTHEKDTTLDRSKVKFHHATLPDVDHDGPMPPTLSLVERWRWLPGAHPVRQADLVHSCHEHQHVGQVGETRRSDDRHKGGSRGPHVTT